MQTTIENLQRDNVLDVVSVGNLHVPEERQALINRTCSFKNQLKYQGFPNEFQMCKEDFYFMLMKEAIQLMDWIDNIDDHGRIVELGRALFGSGGTGKSSLLFFISNYCKIKGWMVLYLPYGSNSSEEVFTERKAEQIVNRFLQDNPNCSIDVSQLESLQGVKKLMKLLDNLYSQQQQKVLVAIDQWNVFLQKLREKKNNDGLFLDFFNTFQTSGDLENGVFIGALSSQSFFSLPLDVFPDATKQSSSIVLSACSNEEFKSHIHLAFHTGLLKEVPKKHEVENYLVCTGGIPRLLYWALNSQSSFKTKVFDYYSQRMIKFIDRCKLGNEGPRDSKVLSNEDIAASVYLNKKIICSESSITAWIESGLLVRISAEELEGTDGDEMNTFDAPCPLARTAIYSCLASKSLGIVQFLISDKQTKGKALELLFIRPFLSATVASPVVLTLKDTTNKSHSIQVQRVVHQSRPRYSVYPIIAITTGTLLVCHDDHQLIDFFVYTTEGKCLYIQVSHMAYRQHCSGIKRDLRLLWEDITRKTKQTNSSESSSSPTELVEKRRIKTRSAEFTPKNYYRKCCGLNSTTKPSTTDQIIYLTTSPNVPKTINSAIAICSFEANCAQFGVTSEFLSNSTSYGNEDDSSDLSIEENSNESEENDDNETREASTEIDLQPPRKKAK